VPGFSGPRHDGSESISVGRESLVVGKADRILSCFTNHLGRVLPASSRAQIRAQKKAKPVKIGLASGEGK